jgi:hypothetical protein
MNFLEFFSKPGTASIYINQNYRLSTKSDTRMDLFLTQTRKLAPVLFAFALQGSFGTKFCSVLSTAREVRY